MENIYTYCHFVFSINMGGWEGVPLYMLIIGITLKEDQLDFIMLNHLNLFSFDTHSVTVS